MPELKDINDEDLHELIYDAITEEIDISDDYSIYDAATAVLKSLRGE